MTPKGVKKARDLVEYMEKCAINEQFFDLSPYDAAVLVEYILELEHSVTRDIPAK